MKTYQLTDGWQFAKLPDCTPESFTQLPENGFEPVTLPHTWYSDDDQYRGLTVYCRQIAWDKDWDCVFLSFEGADQRCLVYADGLLLGEHRGGYSRFRFALPRPDTGVTKLTVLLDNRLDETISPHFGDFTIFGGLYRPVELIVCGKDHFDYTYHGTNGVIGRARVDENGDGEIALEGHICTETGNVQLRYTLLAPNGEPSAACTASASETASLRVESPLLWDGQKAAPLYTLRAVLLADGQAADEVELRLGFRKITLSPENGLSLNGERVRLHGVAKHQDIGLKYNAVSAADIRADFALIGEIGANAVRLSHYQHAQTAYDCADEQGLLVWAEIPMLKMTEDQALFENAKEQLTELILQNIHHPSIFCWGIQNEIAMFKDAPYMHEQCGILHELCKALDPDRFSACANLYPLKPKSKLNEITDLVGYNIYFGWYYGQMTDYGDYLDRFHKARPALPLGISEYGVDSNLALHSEEPHIKDYTEEYQALWHETVYPQIESRPWLWGSFVWNMFDFSSARRNEGGVKFVNGKGLVSRDRQTKKDAFYYYKARWSTEPFVHLCGHRFIKRCRDQADVKVYTNQSAVQLWLGDTCFAEGENDGNGTVLFRNVPLATGENRLEVRSGHVSDALTLEWVDTPEPSYRLPGGDSGEVKNWFLTDDYTRQGYFSVNDTANDILDAPAARAVLEKYVPGLVKLMTEKDVIPLGLTIKSILGHDSDPAAAEALTRKINTELNKIENLF